MRIFLIFLLLPIKLFSQDIEGVWTGTIYNDTTKKYIPYEIAISENNGKLSGYSHTVFTVENNRQETGVKSLKIKKRGSKILIEDDELIYNNYTDPPPKGVKQYSVLNLTLGPSGEYLVGAFNTNRTKEYASLTGTINLQKKNKITESKLIAKLDELNLSHSLSFTQNREKQKGAIAMAVDKKTPVISPQTIQQKKDIVILPDLKKESNNVVKIEKYKAPININEDTIGYKVDVIETEAIARENKKKKSVKSQIVLVKKKDLTVTSMDEKKPQITVQPKEKIVVASISPKVADPLKLNQPNVKTKEIIISQSNIKKVNDNYLSKEKAKEQVMTTIAKPVQKSTSLPGPVISSEELGKRKIETIRTVDFKSDSLVLTLYDNGVVDGDTVSVILNGKIIMPNEGLSTKAITKTIYITPDLGDSLQLIMYAENLGSIPPNTGLLIIQDGDDSYQIRFAGDLQKNSAIILRRKKN